MTTIIMSEIVSPDYDQSYIGREWVFAKLEKTLDLRTQLNVNTCVTAVFGCAGSGKTALFKQLIEIKKFKDYLLAFVECTQELNIKNFINSVESQMKDKLNNENNLSNNINTDVNEVLTVDDLFQKCILFPLLEAKNMEKDQQRYIIVLDSIDTNADICQLISNHMHLLPKWLHIIISARPKRRKGFTKMFSGSRKIVIDDMRKLNVINDMKAFIMHRIRSINCRPLGTTGRKALNQIGIKSNGCFLYVKLILDCFERGIIKTSEVDTIGATLNGLYIYLCSKLFDSNIDYEFHYKSIISLIIVSPDLAMSREALEKCLNWDIEFLDNRIDELCMHSILEINNNYKICLTHTTLIEWLTDVKHCTNRFLCDQSFGHIIQALCNSLPNINEHHFHVFNSCIPNFSIHHYALWLLLSIDTSISVHTLTQLIEDSPIIHFIQKCRNTLNESHYMSQSLSICDSNSPKYTSNENIENSNEFNVIDESPQQSDTEYEDLVNQFSKALLKCDIPTVRDILTNDSTDMLNQYIIEEKTPLFWAINSANISLVELLIEFEVDINCVCDIESGLTPLMIAVSLNILEMCELLLDNDSDVDASDTLGRSPLVHAILEHCSPKIIELLLFWGAHTDYIDANGSSLLCLASSDIKSCVECVRLLLAVGCDELHKDNNGRTSLHMAAAVGNTDIVEVLLDIGGETLLMVRDNDGKLALHDCAIGGFIDTARHLITNESINVLSHEGKSPLRLAALNSYLDLMTLLIENNANVNYIDADGRTTVYCVASSAADDLKVIDILQHLIKLGADLEIKDLEGRTPLHVSAWQGITHVVQILLEFGSDVNSLDNEGRTALHMCAWNGHTEIITLLIEAGAQLNQVSTTQGATPLLIAAQQGHIETCQMLLNVGADVSHIDFYGRNAKDVANNCGHRDIVILLESYMSKVEEQCPTLSSHASTAETAAIAEIEALLQSSTQSKIKTSPDCLNKSQSSRKHKKVMSISKLTKLLH
ncbi:ankyrin repeat domain-containing protein 50-like [Oppia nitens]|uniref:ankyrin repeat domain-containing protein 50-like n=1 Tax=Oppia nitens TaxID=1686743 RepID=UPI0023DACC32|nr:ankyrin repeat domain-containing protein 50-like [Oppia nitens]